MVEKTTNRDPSCPDHSRITLLWVWFHFSSMIGIETRTLEHENAVPSRYLPCPPSFFLILNIETWS